MWFKITSFLRHTLLARNRYAVHSPFMYQLADQVLRAKPDAMCRAIHGERQKALQDHRVLRIQDHGAGYGGQQVPEIRKQVRQVVKSSACGLREGTLLYHLRRHLRPEHSLELGTNLGFSAWYQLAGYSGTTFVSLEGSDALLEEARSRIMPIFPNVDLRCVEFSEALPNLCARQKYWNWVYLDGNHRYEPMMAYIKDLLPAMADGAYLLVDDLYWSPEMNRFWNDLINMEEVSVSLNLYHIGICFIRRNQAKEHFRLRW